jgi:hypothetical protein
MVFRADHKANINETSSIQILQDQFEQCFAVCDWNESFYSGVRNAFLFGC